MKVENTKVGAKFFDPASPLFFTNSEVLIGKIGSA